MTQPTKLVQFRAHAKMEKCFLILLAETTPSQQPKNYYALPQVLAGHVFHQIAIPLVTTSTIAMASALATVHCALINLASSSQASEVQSTRTPAQRLTAASIQSASQGFISKIVAAFHQGIARIARKAVRSATTPLDAQGRVLGLACHVISQVAT